MPNITNEQAAANIAEYHRLEGMGYRINATSTGYTVHKDGAEVAGVFSRYYPDEATAEQYARNFLAAAITSAKEHAGEITRALPLRLGPSTPDPVTRYGISDESIELFRDTVRKRGAEFLSNLEEAAAELGLSDPTYISITLLGLAMLKHEAPEIKVSPHLARFLTT